MPTQSLFDDETSAPAFPPAPTMMPTAFSINVPSKTANAAAPAATGTTKPQLQGLLQTLPHSVTTFSVSSEPCTLLHEQNELTGEALWHHQAAAARPATDVAPQGRHLLLLSSSLLCQLTEW